MEQSFWKKNWCRKKVQKHPEWIWNKKILRTRKVEYLRRSLRRSKWIQYRKQQPEISEIPETIYVDICGAVTSPGVYELPSGSRVFQAIEKAGGYLPEAAASYLNRAKGLSDGQQIYVPTQAEVDSQMIQVTENGQEATSETVPGNNNGEESAGENTSTDQKINLNTADVSQLTTLTGVGESKALAIIAYREENGPFTSTEDIMSVPGIKEGTYEKIKDKIAIK